MTEKLNFDNQKIYPDDWGEESRKNIKINFGIKGLVFKNSFSRGLCQPQNFFFKGRYILENS